MVDREEFRKRVQILIPQMIPQFLIFKRGKLKSKKKTDCPISWTPAREKEPAKILTNNRKEVGQRRLGRKLGGFRMYHIKTAIKIEHFFLLVLDDEKYFTYNGSNMQGDGNYYTTDKSKCPDNAYFAGKRNIRAK